MAENIKARKLYSNGVHIAVVGIVFVLVVVSTVLVITERNRHAQMMDQIEQIELQVFDKRMYYEQLVRLSRNEEQLISDLAESQLYVPVGKDEANVLETITQTVHQAQGTLENFRFQAHQPISGLPRAVYSIPFTFSMRVDPIGLVRMLDDLYTNERIYVIKRVNMVRSERPNELRVEIVAECFYSMN